MLTDYDGSDAAAKQLARAAALALRRGEVLEVRPQLSRRQEWLLGFGEGLAGFVPVDRAELLASLGAEADRELRPIAEATGLSWRILDGADPSSP